MWGVVGARSESVLGELAGYALLSGLSVLLPFVAPFTAVLLWYAVYDWRGSTDESRAIASTALVVLALAMTGYAVIVVGGLVYEPAFAEGALQ